MTMAVALAAFFLVLGLLRDENEESLIPAGISASAVMVTAVIIRRAICRNIKCECRQHGNWKATY